MNTVLLEIGFFALPLFIMGLTVKYIFKLDASILLPSTILLVLFVLLVIFSPFTPKHSETELFAIFCVLQLTALAAGVLFMSKQEIVWKHFFASLPFQLFYWLLLFYYGGLLFTHKFEV